MNWLPKETDMKFLDNAKGWLLRVALKKAGVRVVHLLVARLMALELSKFGIALDQETLTVALLGGLEVLRNWLKMKFNLSML